MGKGITQFEVGETIDLFLLVRQATKGVASNGKPFLTLILQDQTGDIESKLWDVSDDDVRAYLPETIVKVSGEVTNYRGRFQLKIRQIRPSQLSDGISVSDLLETAPVGKEDLLAKLTQYIFEMQNPNLQRITRHLVKKYQNRIFRVSCSYKKSSRVCIGPSLSRYFNA